MSLLSRLGLVGLGGGHRLESEPLAGWRRRLQSLLRGMARGCFFAMGFHWVEVSGEQVIAERVFFLGNVLHTSRKIIRIHIKIDLFTYNWFCMGSKKNHQTTWKRILIKLLQKKKNASSILYHLIFVEFRLPFNIPFSLPAAVFRLTLRRPPSWRLPLTPPWSTPLPSSPAGQLQSPRPSWGRSQCWGSSGNSCR